MTCFPKIAFAVGKVKVLNKIILRFTAAFSLVRIYRNLPRIIFRFVFYAILNLAENKLVKINFRIGAVYSYTYFRPASGIELNSP